VDPTRQGVWLTGRPHGGRRLPPARGDGELAGGDTGHGKGRGGYRWTQERVAVLVVVETVAGVACFAGDEVPRRRCFGRRWFRPFPAAKRGGKRGESISEARGVQFEREKERRRPVPADRRRPEAAELELDLELGRLWREVGGSGGGLGVWRGDREEEKGSGAPYIGWPRFTVGVAYGRPRDRLWKPLERGWSCPRRSWGWSRAPGRRRESGGVFWRPRV